MEERKSWICTVNSENFDVIRKKKVWGVAPHHKKQIEQVTLETSSSSILLGKSLEVSL